MLHNRSVPTDGFLPHLVYCDVAKAVDFLSRAFGFAEHYRYGDPDAPEGAQLYAGSGLIMLTLARPGRESPARAGVYTQTLSLFVDDVQAHLEASRRAGAKIVEELQQTMYGERQYVAEDPEGHRWLFSQHARDVSPEEWGAQVARSARPSSRG